MNLSKKDKIMRGFYFKYAGVVEVSIHVYKNCYKIIGSGFAYLGGVLCFSPDSIFHSGKYESLFDVILAYNFLIHDVIKSMDWYYPEFFDDENFRKVYNRMIY